jgi:hypothetical protein
MLHLFSSWPVLLSVYRYAGGFNDASVTYGYGWYAVYVTMEKL